MKSQGFFSYISLVLSVLFLFVFSDNVSANNVEAVENQPTVSQQQSEDQEVYTPIVQEELEDGVMVEETADGEIIVTKRYSLFRVNVYRWDTKWNYTHIAVGTTVLGNAINHALYSGIGATISPLVPIPGWAIQGLLNGAGWTNLGSKPGQAVAQKWDKNKNGWVGFYFQKGYDVHGNVVPTRYSTR